MNLLPLFARSFCVAPALMHYEEQSTLDSKQHGFAKIYLLMYSIVTKLEGGWLAKQQSRICFKNF
jgi:hypothetical protein